MITTLTQNQVVILIAKDTYQKYVNSPIGRDTLAADCPPEIVAEVMAVWGEEPTVEDYEPEELPPTPAQEIADIKRQIADTDYKIIKCSECRLVDKPMPYDVAALHRERQALRDEINRLEATTP